MGQISSVLGAVSPVLGTLSGVVNAAESVSDLVTGKSGRDRAREEELRAKQAQALRDLERQQTEKLRQSEEDTALSRERLKAEVSSDEKARLASLRRAVARQRTKFASQGVAGTGGSTEAVLLGLFEESDTERQDRQRLDDIRNRALDQELESQKRLNVLQRNQLQERQHLERVTSGF